MPAYPNRHLEDRLVQSTEQWGTWAPDTNLTLPGTGADDWPPMRRMSKKTAGRHLDGRTWDQYPTSRPILSAGAALIS